MSADDINAITLAAPPPTSPDLPPELQPRAIGLLGGVPYELRLRAEVERVWPILAGALRAAGGGALLSAFARELFEAASVRRPAGDPRRVRERHQGKLEGQLREMMTVEGVPLELAWARLGEPRYKLRQWLKADVGFADRVEGYKAQAAAKLHGALWSRATAKEGGSERAAMFLAERQHGGTFGPPPVALKVDEASVEQSATFQRFVRQVEATVCEGCRERLKGEG